MEVEVEVEVAPQWRHNGATMAPQWRRNGAAMTPKWRQLAVMAFFLYNYLNSASTLVLLPELSQHPPIST